MRTIFVIIIIIVSASSKAIAQETQQCYKQEIDSHKSVICLHDPGLFHHWLFSLTVDGQLIFNVVDDFVEQVNLTHSIPPGLTMELPLSQGKSGEISLVGGCVPEVEKEIEIARVCNFSWGNVKIIDNIRFVHEHRHPPE
jgi:hypothetical protein